MRFTQQIKRHGKIFNPYSDNSWPSIIIALALVALLCGWLIYSQEKPKGPIIQTCEMCGSEWEVYPRDPNRPVPSTVEWCFNDGSYCEEGFKMIIESMEHGETPEQNVQWINHCMRCKGCRCAAFSPERWKELMEALERI